MAINKKIFLMLKNTNIHKERYNLHEKDIFSGLEIEIKKYSISIYR